MQLKEATEALEGLARSGEDGDRDPTHRVSARGLHFLVLSLARDRRLRSLSRRLAGASPDRVTRVTGAFNFVAELGATPSQAPPGWGRLRRFSRADAPAVLLSALLQALGERVRIERTRELAFVCVELDEADLARVPPHAGVLVRGSRYFLPLDPRPAPRSLGFLPRKVRMVLRQRVRCRGTLRARCG